MKRFVITTLLCVTATTYSSPITVPQASPSQEKMNLVENWDKRNQSIVVTQKSKALFTIEGSHVPTNHVLPHGAQLLFPVPTQDYVQNKDSWEFKTDGSYEEGSYCNPEKNNDARFLWSIVKDLTGKKYVVPTARLMIHVFKEDLEKAGFEENWKDRESDFVEHFQNSPEWATPLKKYVISVPKLDEKALKKAKKALSSPYALQAPNITAKDIPARGFLPRNTEVYFPAEDGSFKHGVYRSPDIQPNKDGSSKFFCSTIIDDNDKRYSVPTARLMIKTQTLIELENASQLPV